MWYSCITTLAIWVYNEKEVVFADFSNPNTSFTKIIDLLRPVDEWTQISFSGRQNAENEHSVTLKKLVHKFNFHYLTCLYKTLNVVFVNYYSSKLRYIEKEVVFADNSIRNKSIYKIFDLIPVDVWAEIAFSGQQNAENKYCETQKKLVQKLNCHHLTCLYITLNVVYVYFYSSKLSYI